MFRKKTIRIINHGIRGRLAGSRDFWTAQKAPKVPRDRAAHTVFDLHTLGAVGGVTGLNYMANL